MPRAYDRNQLIIDRDPLNQLDVSISRLPTLNLDPEAIFQAFLNSIKDLTGIDLGSVQLLIDSIGDAFGALIEFLTDLVDVPAFLAVMQTIVDFFAELADQAGFLGVFEDVINFFAGLTDHVDFLDMLRDVIGYFLELTDPTNFLTVLDDVINFFADLVDRTEFLSILSEVIEFLSDLGGAALTALLAFVGWLWNGVTDGFAGFGATVETVLKPIIEFLNWVWSLFTDTISGDLIDTLLKPIFEFLKTANLQALTGGILNSLWSLLNGGAEGIGRTLADVITSVGEFVEGLIPAITGIPGALSIGSITTWAEDVLTKALSWPDFKSIFGEIPEDILGVLPVANINLVNPELMSQGGFDTTTTLAAGTGWAWDGTTTNSGSGGSAKVTGNGTARALYSNQSIAVAPGDKLFVSCFVKSTGTIGAGAITLSVVEFSGAAVAGSQSAGAAIASRAGSASFVQIGSTPSVGTVYTVPAGVTSIRVKVAVTSGAAIGSFVWFDDISVKKTGLLSGNWMGGILGTVVQDFQQIVDALAQAIRGVGTAGSGNALTSILTNVQTIFTRLFNTLALPTSLISNPLLEAAIPGIQASKITSGSFGTDRITDDAITQAKIGPEAVTTTELGTDAVTNAKIATNAVGTNEIATNAVTTALINNDAVTNAKIAADAVTANEILNGTITTPLLDPSVVTGITTTVKATTVGTGAVLARINPAGAHIAVSSGAQAFASTTNPFFNTLTRSTADITTPTSSVTYSGTVYTFYTGEFIVTFPGWYMCEVGLRINVSTLAGGGSYGGPGSSQFTPNYNVSPILYRKPSGGTSVVHGYGTEVMGLATAVGAQRCRFANASWIVYLAAGDSVQAGYDAGFIEGTAGQRTGFFGSAGTGNDSYFAIALLNRS